MQNFDIVRETKPNKSFRVASVMSMFDLQSEHIKERFVGNLDLPDSWNVGVIYGSSGTGKTTIAKELFKNAYFNGFQYGELSILDDFSKDLSVKDITNMFNKVGFSSPPSWLKPYSVLSNGEKMRVDLARALLENGDLIVFDEFTSVVDRKVAKVGSAVVSKVVRKNNSKFVAVSCHEDILDWLEPDWVFNTDTMNFFFTKGKYKRPKIELQIYRCERNLWRLFRKYHYLNTDLATSSRCYCALYKGSPIAFFAVIHTPHPKVANFKSSHRLVVLPDYQGLGIGVKLQEFVAQKYVNDGYRFIATTSNRALINARSKSNLWKLTSSGRKVGFNTGNESLNKSLSYKRLTTSWEYVGV